MLDSVNATVEIAPTLKSDLKPAFKAHHLEPQISNEAREQNYSVIRNGFLNKDKDGRCLVETGVCGDAFVELKTKCADPDSWTREDMEKQEIRDLVMTYRALSRLHGNNPLISDEQAILRKLLGRQQAMNAEKSKALSTNVSIKEIQSSAIKVEQIAANQSEVNRMIKALQEGVITEELRYAVGNSGPLAVWAQPGNDMSAELTTAVVKLYAHDLSRTDRDRASDIFPSEPIRRPMTEQEKAELAAKLQELEKARKAKELAKAKKYQPDNENPESPEEKIKGKLLELAGSS